MEFKSMEERNRFYSELVLVRSKDLYRRAYRILNNSEDAKDIVQDVLLSAWEKLEQLRDPEKVAEWLFSIASNKSIMRYRENYKISELNCLLSVDPSCPMSLDTSIIMREEMLETLMSMSRNQQLHIYLSCLCGYEPYEVCKMLNINEHTRSAALYKARQSFIKKYIHLIKNSTDML